MGCFVFFELGQVALNKTADSGPVNEWETGGGGMREGGGSW